jgi:hypothetical protein
MMGPCEVVRDEIGDIGTVFDDENARHSATF